MTASCTGATGARHRFRHAPARLHQPAAARNRARADGALRKNRGGTTMVPLRRNGGGTAQSAPRRRRGSVARKATRPHAPPGSAGEPHSASHYYGCGRRNGEERRLHSVDNRAGTAVAAAARYRRHSHCAGPQTTGGSRRRDPTSTQDSTAATRRGAGARGRAGGAPTRGEVRDGRRRARARAPSGSGGFPLHPRI